MASSYLVYSGILLVAYIVYKWINRNMRKRAFRAFAEANNCEEAPLLGNFIDNWARGKEFHRIMAEGGDFLDDFVATEFDKANTSKRVVIDGSTQYITNEPAIIQAVLATQFDDFETGPLRHSQLSPLLGKSIFSSDGPFWEHSRGLLRPQFSRENINDLEDTEKAASLLIEAAAGSSTAPGEWTDAVDLQPLFFNFTLDTATNFLFGESANSLTDLVRAKRNASKDSAKGHQVDAKEDELPQNPGAQANREDFRDALMLVSDCLLGRIRLGRLYWISDSFKFRRAVRQVKLFTSHFVNKAIVAAATVEAVEKQPPPTSKKSKNLLYALATRTQDKVELQSQTIAVLFAGRDTTAALLGWCFLRLAQHPDIYAALRKEILATMPDPAQASSNPITFSLLKSCRPLQHFINEVLRLHPTVPFNNRVASRNTTIPIGGGPSGKAPVAIAKGQTVGYSVYFMHRRKDLWGEDAVEFRPSRWEERVPAWQFLPFNGGPRICLGQQYAITEAGYVIVRFLQEFDRFEGVGWSDALRMKKGLGLTMWSADGCNLRMRRAQTGR